MNHFDYFVLLVGKHMIADSGFGFWGRMQRHFSAKANLPLAVEKTMNEVRNYALALLNDESGNPNPFVIALVEKSYAGCSSETRTVPAAMLAFLQERHAQRLAEVEGDSLASRILLARQESTQGQHGYSPKRKL